MARPGFEPATPEAEALQPELSGSVRNRVGVHMQFLILLRVTMGYSS